MRREVHAARGREGVVLSPVERVLDDTPFRCAIAPGDLLAPGMAWTTIDYAAIDSPHVEGSVEWTFDRAVLVPGLASWFDTDLGHGFGFSSAPGAAAQAYRQIYIPFRTPVSVDAGDRVRVDLSMRLVLQEYVWAWKAFVTRGTAEREVISQNSLAEAVIDPLRLHRAVPSRVPALGPAGLALRSLIGRMDGSTSVEAIAAELRRQAPAYFMDAGSAIAFVSEWVSRVSQLDRGAS